LVSRELKARYRGSVLGFVWSFVNPLLLLLIYTFVFTVVLPGVHPPELEPFALFMFCGILPWTWFSSSLLESSNVLIAGGHLLTLWFFATPIIYPISQAPERVRRLLNLNPFTHLAVAYQEVLFRPGPFAQVNRLIAVAVASIVVFLAGYFVFDRLRDTLAEEV